jgi:hypothetical protein
MIRYSKKAMLQLMNTAIYQLFVDRVFRCPYHAYVMKQLEKTNMITVKIWGLEITFSIIIYFFRDAKVNKILFMLFGGAGIYCYLCFVQIFFICGRK